jgi:phosphoglycerate dehydrogenase-like enzyme
VAGAALDVFEREPVPIPGIAAHPRVLATPHLAGHTVESHAARARHLAEALDELVGRWIAEGTR